jgi:HEAT repeat protein
MRPCLSTSLGFDRRLGFLALALILCGFTPLAAQSTDFEPVEQLRVLLREPFSDTGKRDRDLKKQIRALTNLGELRRALLLREWRDQDEDPKIAAIDGPNRLALADRFERCVRSVLQQGDEACCLAVLNMLAEMGTTVHGVHSKHSMARVFGRDLVELTRRSGAELRAAALRALGLIDPEPEVALSAFSTAFFGEDANDRLAAADGVAYWMRMLAQAATRGADPNGIEVTRADFVSVGRAVISLAACGLHVEQPEVRRRSAAVIGYSAMVLHNWLRAARSHEALRAADDARRRTEEDNAELRPLVLVIEDQHPALSDALEDADADVRSLAGRALEDLTILETFVQEQGVSVGATQTALVPASDAVPPTGFVPVSSLPKEPEGVPTTVRALAAQLAEPNVETRRAALETLEALGPDAAPAIGELVRALGDSDKFIRWAAARTLGKIGPMQEQAVVLALAQLLTDGDLDVRLAAAAALERWGAAAKAAEPDLRRCVGSTDAELRRAALRALGAIGGPEAHAAIPEATAALADADARVRYTAARVLGKFGPVAKDATPALRQALEDESAEVQRAAGEALLNILRPRQE